jgi:hypothetical protein
VTKSRNIQNAGAEIAMIINHHQNYSHIHSVSDDGTGEDIKITTILIPEEEGEIIKKHFILNPEEDLIIELNHKFKEKSKNSDIRIFFSPYDEKIYKFFSELNQQDTNFLLKKTNFIPIYAFKLNEEKEKNIDYKKMLFDKDKCMCGTKYCEDYKFESGSTGREILKEAIRQKCIFLITSNNNNNNQAHLYFDYMKLFYSMCLTKNHFNDECSNSCIDKIDPQLKLRVDQCTIMSFNYPKETYTHSEEIYKNCRSNIHLDEASHFLSNFIRKALPLIFINDNLFYGQLKKSKLIQAICHSMINAGDLNYCNTFISESKTLSFYVILYYYSIFILLIIGVVFINVILLLIYKLYFRNRNFGERENSNLHELNLEENLQERKEYSKIEKIISEENSKIEQVDFDIKNN